MGKIPFGIIGPFIGKTGSVIGYMLNDQAVMRGLPRKSNKALTKGRKNSCGRISVISKFLKSIGPFVNVTFAPESRDTVKNWYNLAMEYNNPHAIKGVYPYLEMDYAKVILSRGQLKKPLSPVVELLEEGVKFSWDTPKDDKTLAGEAMMLVYFPESDEAFYKISGVHRSVGHDFVEVQDQAHRSMMMETYMTFVSSDRQLFSDSVYVGSIIPEGAKTAFEPIFKEEIAVDSQPKITGAGHEDKKKNKLKKTSLTKGDLTELDITDPEAAAYQKTILIAYNLKKMGIPYKDIVTATGLSLVLVKSL